MVDTRLLHHFHNNYQFMEKIFKCITWLTQRSVKEPFDLIQEYPSNPHKEVPVYYEIGQHQLKDEELLVFDDSDLSATDS